MTKRQNILTSLAVAIFAAFVVFTLLFRTQTADWITSLSFTPTPEMATLRDSLQLTPRADLIFSASHPELNDRETFVLKCPISRPDSHVLGCFSSSRTIHVYNITLDELAGIQESTLAHELLHAIYDRHTAATLTWLNPLLREAYEANKPALQENMSFYDDSELLNELHSRLGTEIYDLPEQLERYYADFFHDQNRIVDFYKSYNTRLLTLREEARLQLEQIETLSKTIEDQRAKYIEDSNALTRKIEDFNRRAQSGTMTQAAYNRERAALLAEGSRLDDYYNTISANIALHNQLVEVFNANALSLQTLNDAMSTSPPPVL